MSRGLLTLFAGIVLCGCATPSVQTADGPIAPNLALLGETRNDRGMGDYDWLVVGGVDKRWRALTKPPFIKEKNRFHQVPAGRHTVFVRIMATAQRGLPGLRDGEVKFENVELDGGKAYIVNGQRTGEEFDVWIEDFRTKEHITTAIKIKPPRQGLPALFSR